MENKRAIVDQMRIKLKVLQDNLQMYRKYDGKEIDLQQMLQSVNSFVSTQNTVNAKYLELQT